MAKSFIKTIIIIGILFLSISFKPSSVNSEQNSLSAEKTSLSLPQEATIKTPGKGEELLRFTSGGHVLGFKRREVIIASTDHALRVEFEGSREVTPVAETAGQAPDRESRAAQPLGRVVYRNLWDGVNLTYESHGGGVVKSTYVVEPSGSVENIRLRYNTPVKVDRAGNLVISFERGELRESHPVAWQEINGQRVPVDISFRLITQNEVGFSAGRYNLSFPLIIDPVLSWNTFLGSTGNDSASGIAVDGSGNIYVVGGSSSSWGTPINSHSGYYDAFIAKLNSNGILQWNTFLGSSSHDDYGRSIAVDKEENIYIIGTSYKSWGTPISPHNLNSDAFIAKLNSSGILIWNTFLGSSGYDDGYGITVDGDGNIYVTGSSSATWGSPIIPFSGGYDAFVAKINSNGFLQWNTFLGSSTGWEFGRSIAVDETKNIYITGDSGATWGTPINPHSGNYDVFVAKLNSNGVLQWHTFLGSSASDEGYDIAVDAASNIFVTGVSCESWKSPIYQFSGSSDAFVAKLNSSGSLLWHTFLGSRDSDQSRGIDLDGEGNIFIVGKSNASWGTPINSYSAGFDVFVAKLNSSGILIWNTFLGASNYWDWGNGIAVDAAFNVYIAGESDGGWGTPINHYIGGTEAFVAKISEAAILNVDPQIGLSSSGPAGGPFSPPSQTITLKNIGDKQLIWAATNSASWLSLDKRGGILNGGELTTVTITINSNANILEVGSYTDTIIFTNITNGEGNTTRSVNLTVYKPGTLDVNPQSGLVSSGKAGGSFSPSSQIYTLQNTGSSPLEWTVIKSAEWITLDIMSGTLFPGEWTTVTVSINSNANSLQAGNYRDTVYFTNTTNGQGNTSREVSLTVLQPAVLSVTPMSGLNSSGPAGGSFSPISQIYTLKNTGDTSLNWTVNKSASWLTLDKTSGMLEPGDSTTVTVSINSNANSLPVGNYSDTVTFTNTTNGQGNTTRIVSLTIHVPMTLKLVGQRLETRAWIIRFEYAKLSIGIIKNFPVEVSKYVLLRKAGNQSYSAVKEFTESDVVNNAITYNDPNLNRAETYSYVVEARSSDGSVIARSNEVVLGTRSALSVEGDTKALIKEKVNK